MKQLYKIAVNACKDVYYNNIDLGTTEYILFDSEWKSEKIQVLAIAGSNERKDWAKNFNLQSKKGIKKVAVDAAKEIKDHVLYRRLRNPRKKLLVTGHSKSGPTAIAFKRLFDAAWCIVFAPARSLRYWTDREMENTTIFIDPDDPVSKLGFISFGHPKCKIIKAKNDHIGINIDDHYIDCWCDFVENMSNEI